MTKKGNEPYKPMAAEVTVEDRIEALTIRIGTLEDRVSRHEEYHFGPNGPPNRPNRRTP
jgi:hypothetical protein